MEEQKGNPEIGMDANSFEEAETTSSGSKEFFNDLESQVNGGIIDTEATPNQEVAPKQVTHANNEEGSNNVEEQSNRGTDWEKRYTDSSREAVKWRDRYKEVEQFVPVLDAMKKDSGLVDHVRNYLVDGGKPAKSIQDNLKLGEDFVFDQQEAMTDPDSDSAKLMNAHVDSLVQTRVGEMVQTEQQRAQQIYVAKQKEQQEVEFKEKHNMNNEEFEAFKADAKQHVMTLDDINVILNQGNVAKNVASSTKKEMMNQMKNVRNMPTSASGANSQGETVSEERDVFNSILGNDNSVDNLFG
jgi:soluble cytochrome b562